MRRLTGPVTAESSVNWDLRYPSPALPPPPNRTPRTRSQTRPAGPVMPGAYKVSLAKRQNGVITPL